MSLFFSRNGDRGCEGWDSSRCTVQSRMFEHTVVVGGGHYRLKIGFARVDAHKLFYVQNPCPWIHYVVYKECPIPQPTASCPGSGRNTRAFPGIYFRLLCVRTSRVVVAARYGVPPFLPVTKRDINNIFCVARCIHDIQCNTNSRKYPV